MADHVTSANQVNLIQQVFHIINRLEKVLEKLLTHPDSLETVIKNTLRSYPHYYQTLSNLLKHYDHQNQSPQEIRFQ